VVFISKLFMAYCLVSLDAGIGMTEVSTPLTGQSEILTSARTATRIECTVFNPFSYGRRGAGDFPPGESERGSK